MRKYVVATILIMFFVIMMGCTSTKAGSMQYSYKNGNFNIWGEGVQTTFADYGYVTEFEVDGSEVGVSNGSATNNNVSLRIDLSYVSDRNYVKVKYIIKNESGTSKRVGVASHADIMIGSNDYAPITNLSRKSWILNVRRWT